MRGGDWESPTRYIVLYDLKRKSMQKLYLWDKEYTHRTEKYASSDNSNSPVFIYKNWILYTDKPLEDGIVKIYLYDINKNETYSINARGIISYFENDLIIIGGKWANFSKIISQIGKDNTDLFNQIPIDCCPNFYYFDGKNVYFNHIWRYDTSLGKVTDKLSLPSNRDFTYGFPIDFDRVIYVDNKLRIADFETDLVEDFKIDFDLSGVTSTDPIFYDHDDNILIVPQRERKVSYILYLNSGKKYEITMIPAIVPGGVDYDEITNILAWVDIRDQYSGRYLPHTDVADIYMAKIPKN